MILKLYSKTKSFLTSVRYKDLKITKEINGDQTLDVSIAVDDGTEIVEEMYLRTEDQEFVIKETESREGGFVPVVAVLNLEDIEGKSWTDYTVASMTAFEAIDLALTSTGWITNTTGITDRTKKRSFQLSNVNSLEIMERIREAYIIETWYDTLNKTVYFADRVGSDKGAYFIEGFNAKTLKRKSDTNDYITRLVPIGQDDMTIEAVNDGKAYVENYQYSNKVIYGIWQDTNYDDVQALKDDAVYKLSEMSRPRVSYSADVIDLAKLSTEYDILSFGIGDTVIIRSASGLINDKQRIVKMVTYPDKPENNTCELGSTTLSFDDYQKSVEAAREVIENVTNKSGIIVGSKIYLPDGTSSGESTSLTQRLAGIDTNIDTVTRSAAAANEKALEAAEAAEAAQESADTASEAATQALQNASFAQNAANEAKEAADAAQEDATAAGLAAGAAQSSADAAQEDATRANKYATGALDQLSVVEDVLGVLNWVTEHATYKTSTDTEVEPGKHYFLRSGSGTSADPYVYSLVVSPTGNPSTQSYYEIDSIDEAVSNYVATHLALTSEGLWVTNDSNSYKILLASDGMKVYDAQGVLVATFGESIDFSSTRPQYIGGDDAYIIFNPTDGTLTIGGSKVIIGSGKKLSEALTNLFIQTTYSTSSITYTAHLYVAGVDIAQSEAGRLNWYYRKKSGLEFIATGYQITVSKEDYMQVVGVQWTKTDDLALQNKAGAQITDKNGNRILVKTEVD